MGRTRDRRIATIDGLRGIAIVLVMWYHVWQISWQSAVVPFVNVSLQPLAETGFVGVALFFFISGFVLLLPYAQAHLTRTAPPSLAHFFGRRALKIVPSYVLSIAVLLAVGYQTYPSVAAAMRDLAFHILFVHDWFAISDRSINGVYWSLGVEVQFYLLFPLLAPLFVRRPLLVTVSLVTIANAWRIWALLANHYFIEQRLDVLPAYLDLFAAGMLGAYAYAAIALRRPSLAKRRWIFSALMLAGFAGLWLLCASCYAQRYDADWPHPWVVQTRSLLALACLSAALGSLFAARALQRVLANRVLLFLAAISYNLYLWHQPLARELVRLRIPPYATPDPHSDRTWMLTFELVALPLAVGVAALATYALERPILRLRSWRPPPRAASTAAERI
ncbi:MAG TPA: acyltransferase [Candidatus Limnocylindria bacterium]|nr:acyltransferase [Candidatus Limnocylindria bacterium]